MKKFYTRDVSVYIIKRERERRRKSKVKKVKKENVKEATRRRDNGIRWLTVIRCI